MFAASRLAIIIFSMLPPLLLSYIIISLLMLDVNLTDAEVTVKAV